MNNLHYPCIAFIGAGNMASCLIGGLISAGYPPKQIWASNPTIEKLNFLQQEFGIHTSMSNETAAKEAKIIVFSVKPQKIQEAALSLKSTIETQGHLVISIAAGVTTESIAAHLSPNAAVVRAMPNIPAFVSSGATGLFANSKVNNMQKEWAENVFRAVGITVWAQEEKQMDVIAALSGSGPAYFFYVMEALTQAAIELGLHEEDAQLLTLQTALGSAKLALATNESFKDLRTQVTSKGGITERALAILEERKMSEILMSAIRAATDKSQALGKS